MSAQDRLAAISARAEAATQGPWDAYTVPATRKEAAYTAVGIEDTEAKVVRFEGSWFDADFIAHARTDIPALVSALRGVLELHRKNRLEDGLCQGYTSTGYGYLDDWCVECSDQSGREYGTPYPCPTVAALGGDHE